MGSLLGVAMGSDEPPAFIVIRYRPANAASGAASGAHLGLVGKGVTFDTGGISIKPADGMEKMKYDMAGGAAMIAPCAPSRQTGDSGDRLRALRRDAGQPRAAAGGHRDRHVRQDHRGD